MYLNCVGSQTKTGRACVLHQLQPHPSFSEVTVLMPAHPCFHGPDIRTTSSTLQFLLLHSRPKRRAEDGMRGFSLLSPGFGKSLVEHWRSQRGDDTCQVSPLALANPRAVTNRFHWQLKKRHSSALNVKRWLVVSDQLPRVFFFFFYLKGPTSWKDMWIKSNGFGKESTMQVYYDNSC